MAVAYRLKAQLAAEERDVDGKMLNDDPLLDGKRLPRAFRQPVIDLCSAAAN